MEKLLGLGIVVQIAACSVVGARLLLLARRTREAPELLLGASFVLLGALGYPLAIAARNGTGPSELLLVALACQDGACLCVYAVNWRTFYPRARWMAGLVALLAAGFAVGLAKSHASGNLDQGPWYYLGFALRAGAFVWAAAESGRFHGRLARRLAIGLGDPVVVDRFWLWTVSTTSISFGFAIFLLGRIFTPNVGAAPGVLAATSVVSVVSGASIWLAFFPPARYTRRISQGGGAFHLFQPPHLEDREEQRVASTLHPIALSFAGGGLAYAVLAGLLPLGPTRWDIALAVFAFSALSLVLVRKGHSNGAATLLLGTTWTAVSFQLVSLGIATPALVGTYVIVLLASGLLLGPRVAAALTGVSSLMPLLVPLVGPGQGWAGLEVAVRHHSAIGSAVVIAVGGILSIAATRQVRRALATSLQQERTLARQNLELEEGRSRYQSLIENLPDVVNEIDESGTNQFVSPNSRDVLGYEPEELLGRSPFDLMPPEDRQPAEQALARILANGEGGRPVFRFQRKDGDWTWFEASGSLYQRRDGSHRVVVLSRDVTERIEAERRLSRQEVRYQKLVESLPIAIFELEPEGRLLALNAAGLRLLELESGDQVVGRRATRLVDGKEREEIAGLLARAARGEAVDFELYRHDGAERRTIVGTLVPLRNDEGEVFRISGHAQDVTEQRRLQEQVQQGQKLESLGVLAGGIAHDFNNLLVGIQGNAEVALSELPPGAAREAVQEIYGAGQLAAGLTRQLLTYAGRGDASSEPLDLSQLVEETGKLLRSAISRRTPLEIDTEADAWACGNTAQLQQVVMNLITNAAEAYGDGTGTVRVRLRRRDVEGDELSRCLLAEPLSPGRYVVLEVSDRGQGMDADTLRQIFDPFFSTKFAGRGLGLAATLGIVREHAGALAVESRPGHGTTFRVLLPVVGARGLPREEPAAVPEKDAGATVLVVDDEPLVRRVARRMLSSQGWNVLEAATGAAAVEKLRAARPVIDCVVLDRTMPGAGGEEVCRALRSIRPDLPVLFVSGDVDPGLVERVGSPDITRFVQKPFRAEDLEKLLRELVSART